MTMPVSSPMVSCFLFFRVRVIYLGEGGGEGGGRAVTKTKVGRRMLAPLNSHEKKSMVLRSTVEIYIGCPILLIFLGIHIYIEHLLG